MNFKRVTDTLINLIMHDLVHLCGAETGGIGNNQV